MIKSLLDVFRMSMLNRPDGSRKEARDHFYAQMGSDSAYLKMLSDVYFDSRAVVMPLQKTEMGYTFQRWVGAKTVSIDGAQKKRVAATKRADDAHDEVEALYQSVILLNLTLPDGKLLRNATGAECKRAGGWFDAIGACIKPTQVVDKHMTEDNLRDIRARFYQANKRRAA